MASVTLAAAMACGPDVVAGGEPTPTGSGGGTPGAGPSGSGSPATTPSGGPSAPPTAPSTNAAVVLVQGTVREVCGIQLQVRFVPPSANGGSEDAAFLVVGAQSATGDQPAPADIAPARAGLTVTLHGHAFTVIAVEPANARVTVQPHC